MGDGLLNIRQGRQERGLRVRQGVFRQMFRNTFQSGFLSILYSIGSKPLQIWDKDGEPDFKLSGGLPENPLACLSLLNCKLSP